MTVLLFLTLQFTNASIAIPKLCHWGTLEFDLGAFFFIDKYKTISDSDRGKLHDSPGKDKKEIVSYDLYKTNYW